MSIKEDIQKIQDVVGSVNELVRMNLLQPLTEDGYIYIVGAMLQSKDKKYMQNFCRNLLRVWVLTFAPVDIAQVELTIFNKDNGDFICRYSESKGLAYS